MADLALIFPGLCDSRLKLERKWSTACGGAQERGLLGRGSHSRGFLGPSQHSLGVLAAASTEALLLFLSSGAHTSLHASPVAQAHDSEADTSSLTTDRQLLQVQQHRRGSLWARECAELHAQARPSPGGQH